jgi:predicted house-cleaning noncanonical NTP pyrophosphatase (MazG superfamily)
VVILKYYKIVRDKIPSIIENSGRKCTTKKVTDSDEKLDLLCHKLIEEAQEFSVNNHVEELADILEVMFTILDLLDVSFKTVEKLRKEKKIERGGFDKGFVLLTVEK